MSMILDFNNSDSMKIINISNIPNGKLVLGEELIINSKLKLLKFKCEFFKKEIYDNNNKFFGLFKEEKKTKIPEIINDIDFGLCNFKCDTYSGSIDTNGKHLHKFNTCKLCFKNIENIKKTLFENSGIKIEICQLFPNVVYDVKTIEFKEDILTLLGLQIKTIQIVDGIKINLRSEINSLSLKTEKIIPPIYLSNNNGELNEY